MIQISEPITLEKLLPLIEQLPQVEREQLRKSLEKDSTTWREEWESITAHFHHAFADAQEDEAERDLDAALVAARRERASASVARLSSNIRHQSLSSCIDSERKPR